MPSLWLWNLCEPSFEALPGAEEGRVQGLVRGLEVLAVVGEHREVEACSHLGLGQSIAGFNWPIKRLDISSFTSWTQVSMGPIIADILFCHSFAVCRMLSSSSPKVSATVKFNLQQKPLHSNHCTIPLQDMRNHLIPHWLNFIIENFRYCGHQLSKQSMFLWISTGSSRDPVK